MHSRSEGINWGRAYPVIGCVLAILAPLAFVGAVALSFDEEVEALEAKHSSAADTETRAVDPDASADLAARFHRSRQDPVVEVLRQLRDGEFDEIRDVATGRFLADHRAHAASIATLDTKTMTLERRGHGWIIVRATATHHRGGEARLRLRIVEDGSVWKLENLKTLRSNEPHA